MDRLTKNHVLPSAVQEEIDKTCIKDFLCQYNLLDNIDIIYNLINECRVNSDTIDLCIKKVINEFIEMKNKSLEDDEKQILERYDIYSKK